MSMVINRRHIILAALVVALGLAIFLNYKLSDGGITTTAKNTKGNLGDTSYVTNQKVSSTKSDAFATARLTRSQDKDEAEQVWKSVTSTSSSTKQERAEAYNAISQIANNITTEGQIETLVKAKGFAECVCIIDKNGSCSVVVKSKTSSGLSASDSAQIFDIVIRETKLAKTSINIVPSN
jgi:stage III sporulation protein AH